MVEVLWWVLACGWNCDVDLERAEGWRGEAAITRHWGDFADSRDPADERYQQGYASREACLATLREGEPAGEHPYTHWVGGEPRFRITITHHEDWVEVRNNANNAHIRYGCFTRDVG
jgi:hypothetical protein